MLVASDFLELSKRNITIKRLKKSDYFEFRVMGVEDFISNDLGVNIYITSDDFIVFSTTITYEKYFIEPKTFQADCEILESKCENWNHRAPC